MSNLCMHTRFMPHFCCATELSCCFFQYVIQTEMKGTVQYNTFKRKPRPWHLDAKSKIDVTCRFSHFGMITRTTAMAEQVAIRAPFKKTRKGFSQSTTRRAEKSSHSHKGYFQKMLHQGGANVWYTTHHWDERIKWVARSVDSQNTVKADPLLQSAMQE